MGRHLASKLPYENTMIAPEQTKAEIDAMLHEFIIIDPNTKRKTAFISGIRWTELIGDMPMLEFMVEYDDPSGIHKGLAIRVKPPLLQVKKGRKYGYRWENAPAQSMRLLYWWLKSRLEAILFGLRDFTQEFLSDVIMKLPNGRDATVGEIIAPQIKESKIPYLPKKIEAGK